MSLNTEDLLNAISRVTRQISPPVGSRPSKLASPSASSNNNAGGSSSSSRERTVSPVFVEVDATDAATADRQMKQQEQRQRQQQYPRRDIRIGGGADSDADDDEDDEDEHVRPPPGPPPRSRSETSHDDDGAIPPPPPPPPPAPPTDSDDDNVTTTAAANNKNNNSSRPFPSHNDVTVENDDPRAANTKNTRQPPPPGASSSDELLDDGEVDYSILHDAATRNRTSPQKQPPKMDVECSFHQLRLEQRVAGELAGVLRETNTVAASAALKAALENQKEAKRQREALLGRERLQLAREQETTYQQEEVATQTLRRLDGLTDVLQRSLESEQTHFSALRALEDRIIDKQRSAQKKKQEMQRLQQIAEDCISQLTTFEMHNMQRERSIATLEAELDKRKAEAAQIDVGVKKRLEAIEARESKIAEWVEALETKEKHLSAADKDLQAFADEFLRREEAVRVAKKENRPPPPPPAATTTASSTTSSSRFGSAPPQPAPRTSYQQQQQPQPAQHMTPNGKFVPEALERDDDESPAMGSATDEYFAKLVAS